MNERPSDETHNDALREDGRVPGEAEAPGDVGWPGRPAWHEPGGQHGDESEPLPERRPALLGAIPRSMRIALVIGLVVGLGGSLVRLPYHSLGPGPSTDVLPLLDVRGAPSHRSAGKLLLTTASVSSRTLTVWEGLWVWIDPDLKTFRFPQQLSDQEQDAENQAAMERSKDAAMVAAFRVLGQRPRVMHAARVLAVVRDAPAAGRLRDGDVVTRVDGKRVRSPADAVAVIRQRRPGRVVRLTVLRGGKARAISVRTGASKVDSSVPVVGIILGTAYRFPASISIDTRRVGGPSGGLVFALSVVDALIQEDLTRGHVVAATGTIELPARGPAIIGPVGGIPEKIRSAARAGADVFLLPAAEASEARRLAPSGIQVIGVRTLEEALRALRRLPPRT